MASEAVLAALIAFAIFALLVPIVPLQQGSPENSSQASAPAPFLGSISRAIIQVGVEVHEDGTVIFKI